MANRWIRTEERLPGEELRENSEFIVMVRGAANATTLLFDGEAWVDENGDPYNVTHWQPLPEPPEK